MPERAAALDIAHRAASSWLDSLADRPVPPQATAAEVARRLGADLPDGPSDPDAVVQLLADACTPGLTAMPGGRFFGFVIGGTHPAALAADWLVSAWDQNCRAARLDPGVAAVEDIAAAWLLDLLGLPAGADVGFVTGATMANFTGLAAGRDAVLPAGGLGRRPRTGLTGGPRVRVLVGAERHETLDLALRYLGPGRAEPVAGRRPGPAARRRAPAPRWRPAGRARRSCCSRRATCTPAPSTRSPRRSRSRTGTAPGSTSTAPSGSGRPPRPGTGTSSPVRGADSWATDAHKTLNVPYDCGLAIVRDPSALRAAMGMHGRLPDPRAAGRLDPSEKVPELSRRARGFPVWAVLRVARPHRRRGPGRRPLPACPGFADGLGAIVGADVRQRRRVHPGLRGVRRRRAHRRR